MKYSLIIFLVLLTLTKVSAQHIQTIEKNLDSVFGKINYWAFVKTVDENINSYDSLEAANITFQELLLQYTSFNPQTISSKFKSLSDSGLRIVTSQDGLFRIYSWDTWTGGTMHNFRNVFQYKNNNTVFSRTIELNKEESDPGCYYNHVYDIVSQNKKYYIAQSRAILSTGLSYHNIKIFSIDNAKLNDTAKLIKTKTGIKNQLGYEIDLTASSNRNRNVPDFYIEYDHSKKIISIPVVLEDSRVASKRILYQFKDRHFEKL